MYKTYRTVGKTALRRFTAKAAARFTGCSRMMTI